MYNAASQLALETNPELYENRRRFFSTPVVTVARRDLSLDDVEHGILRRSHSKYTLGYLRTPGPFRNNFAESHAVDSIDPRIHFAVNCGAKSCPPIAGYTREKLDEQLDLATRGYLDTTVEYEPEAKRGILGRFRRRGRVTLPRVMLWFRGDFGGRDGIIQFLWRYDQLPPDANPRFTYLDWDWTRTPGAYVSGPMRGTPSPAEENQ